MPISPKHITKAHFRPRYIRRDSGTLRYGVPALWTSCALQASVERGRRTNKRSASLRCCVNDAARLDEPELKKREVTHIDLAGRSGLKGE